MKRKCLREGCGVEFEPNKPKQLFCSAKCRVYYSREKHKNNAESQLKPEKPFQQTLNTQKGIIKKDNSARIAELQNELDGLKDNPSRLGKMRKSFLENEIWKLKQ